MGWGGREGLRGGERDAQREGLRRGEGEMQREKGERGWGGERKSFLLLFMCVAGGLELMCCYVFLSVCVHVCECERSVCVCVCYLLEGERLCVYICVLKCVLCNLRALAMFIQTKHVSSSFDTFSKPELELI